MLLIGLLSNRDQEAVVTVTVGKKWILEPPFPYGDKEWSTLRFPSGFDLFRFHFLIFILYVWMFCGMYVCESHVYSNYRGQKRVSRFPGAGIADG